MARKISQTDPALAIEFFLSGFYTHRSQLFAPFKGIGVNVVSFHDPVLDGNNMEDTDLYEWTRRPGFSIFCAQPLPDKEIVNQFYSSRLLTGAVVPWIDTNRRWATFSPTAITTIATKTTASQGYPSTIGNMTYFADGAAADLYKYDGAKLSAWGLAAPTIIPVASGLGFWQADTQYALGNTILDTNGCIETVTAILIPNGSFESPSYAATKALAGSLSQTWTYDAINGGYFVETGYRVVQSGNSQSTNSTVTYTFPAPVTAGDTLVLVFGQGTINYTPTVVSVTDNIGTPYSQQTSATGTYSGGGNNYPSTAWVWTGTAGVSGTCTVTVQTSAVAGSNLFLLAHEISGINPVIVTAVNNFGVNVSTLDTGTVGFSSTALVLSSMLAFTTGGTVPPTGFAESETVSEGEWSLTDSYAAVTSPQTSVWSIPAGNGQALGFSVVFQIPSLTTGYSPYLFLGSYNFAIPSGATIVGIQVSLPKWNVGAGTVVDQSVRLVVGGSVVGNDYFSGATWSISGYSPAVYGGPADKWGLTPSAAQINANGASGFGVAISANITSTTGGSVVPEVGFSGANMPTITIYYKQSNGLGGPGVSGDHEPIWPTYTSGVVNDGGLTWTNYGAIQTWFPVTGYPTPVVVLDPNGFLQLSTYLANPIPAWDSSANYTLGQIVYFGGQYWVSVFNGMNNNVVPTVAYATTGSSTTVPYWALTTTPLVTGLTPPVWNTTIGGMTTDGSYTWTNIGQGTGLAFTGYAYVYGYRTIYGHLTTASPYSNNTGAILGPLNGTITSYTISGNVVTFTGDNNFIPGNIFTATGLTIGTYLNDQPFTVISAIPSSSFPLTSVSITSNVLTIAAVNNLVVGQTVTFSAVGTATFLNGVTVTVLASGLSGSQFEANFTHGNYGPTADTGTVVANGSYTAAFTHANVALTLDSGASQPLISMVTGNGTASPLCNSTANITAVSVVANVVTITASNNFQPGLWVTLTGMTGATFLNNQQLQVIAVDQLVGTQNTYFQVYFETANYVQTADTGTATFNAVEIYRISDGGGTYLFAGAVTNPGTGAFLFNDFVPDVNLDIELIAALGHQNDPPPGAPGSTINAVGSFLSYWQGRFWMAVGNYVYFDAGPDCTNGVPEESWPPGNRFQFAGPVIGTSPSADGAGLLVYLADRVNVIMGGPETISFYPDDALNNFGISNPNALFKDGSILGQFTTQKQYFELIGKEKQEIGEHIADYLTANFTAATTYATMHRNGLDVGVFLSNGVDRVVRYGTNINAWSVPAFPACGAGALRSVETSVGVMSLMLASPTGGVTATIGSVNPTSGTSVGTGVAWANPGNITAGSSASYATVTFSGAATSQILRAAKYTLPAAYSTLAIPVTAVVQGIQVTLVGKQTTTSGLTVTIKPTNAAVGAESHTFTFGTSNTTITFGSMSDVWGMPWNTPDALNGQLVGFDITATYTGLGAPEVDIAEVQLAVTYQNPGNYLYARDVNSWGDGGTFGANNGQPYSLCNVVIGSITLSQPGARLFPLQHVVGYFDAVGTLDNGNSSQPDIWILPNEISDTKGIGFVYLPETLQEPPIGQNVPSTSLLALRWPVNMMNSAVASQYVHHLQVKIQFEPENAPNTIKAISFMEDQTT